MGSYMGESTHAIHCAGFWGALAIKQLLEERSVQVHPPQEKVFLTLRASGPLDVIIAAVAELTGKYQGSRPITVDGVEPPPAGLRPGTISERLPAADPLPFRAVQRCAATTAKRTQCKLPSEPGGTTCAIHAGRAQDERETPTMPSPSRSGNAR